MIIHHQMNLKEVLEIEVHIIDANIDLDLGQILLDLELENLMKKTNLPVDIKTIEGVIKKKVMKIVAQGLEESEIRAITTIIVAKVAVRETVAVSLQTVGIDLFKEFEST